MEAQPRRRRRRRKARKSTVVKRIPRIGGSKVRMTTQRKVVLKVLRESCEHPTVRDIYETAKQTLPGISLATIYNSLKALQRAGMVNEHHVTSGAARFCINKMPHVHMMDEASGRMIDVILREGVRLEDVFDVPTGAEITSMRAYLYGTLPS